MKTLKTIVLLLIIIILMWISVTNTIQAFKCPKMTHTELFLHLPKTIMLNFEKNK